MMMILNKRLLFPSIITRPLRLFSTATQQPSQSVDVFPGRNYARNLDFEETGLEIKDRFQGVKVLKYAAVRGVELNQYEKGNYLTKNTLETLHIKLQQFKGNWTANAIFLSSGSIDFFSLGVHDDDVNEHGIEIFDKIHSISEMIATYPEKNLIALYGGYITGTPFGMFLSSSYRFGTSTTILAIDEPTKGQIPLGGVAYKFCHLCPRDGKVLIRYLVCSGALIDADSLYEFGILSHLTGHKPYREMFYDQTIPVNDTNAVQPPQGDPRYLSEMMRDQDINEKVDDVTKYEVWNRFLRVPLVIPDIRPVPGEGHIKRIFDDVEYCFSAPTVQETITRLQSISHLFAKYALQNMIKCDPFALQAFYALTDHASSIRGEIEALKEFKESRERLTEIKRCGFHESIAKEKQITQMLVERQKTAKETGKGWFNRNVVKKSDFDLSVYEKDRDNDDIVPIQTTKSLKQINEEELLAAAEHQREEEELAKGIECLKADLDAIPEYLLADIKLSLK